MNRCLFALLLAAALLPASGCTFNVDVTTQRTALENQVMGSYRELEDDLILASSVRGGKKQAKVKAKDQEASPSKMRALDARENQQFNRDDLDELKDKGILGEAAAGTVTMLPAGLASGPAPDAGDTKLARMLVDEENADRATIWQRIIESNPNLSDKDLPEVKKTYAKMQQAQSTKGQWYEDDAGKWERKE